MFLLSERNSSAFAVSLLSWGLGREEAPVEVCSDWGWLNVLFFSWLGVIEHVICLVKCSIGLARVKQMEYWYCTKLLSIMQFSASATVLCCTACLLELRSRMLAIWK